MKRKKAFRHPMEEELPTEVPRDETNKQVVREIE